MSILPKNEAEVLNKDNFHTYNAFGEDNEDSNIQTDVRDSSVIEKTFHVKSASGADEVHYFELIEPRTENTVCIESLSKDDNKSNSSKRFFLFLLNTHSSNL